MGLSAYRNMASDGNVISYIHGSKDELMTAEKYSGLKQCDSLDDLRLKLKQTSYGHFLMEDAQLTIKSFKEALYKAMAKDFEYVQSIASENTGRILEFFRDLHKLKNFLYLWACKQEATNLSDFFAEAHPLGMYDELSFIKVTQGPEDTWKFCIENTSLSKYTEGLTHEVLTMETQFLSNLLYKRYLELLYQYSLRNDLFLSNLVQFEGDKRIIELVYGTLDSDVKAEDKRSLFPACTSFGRGMQNSLATCVSLDELKGLLSTDAAYRDIVSSEAGFEEALQRKEFEICAKAFFVYDDASVIYTYFTMQELEIRNLTYAAECIAQGRKDDIDEMSSK